MTKEEIVEYAATVGLTETQVKAMTVVQKIDLLAAASAAKRARAAARMANIATIEHEARVNIAASMKANG